MSKLQNLTVLRIELIENELFRLYNREFERTQHEELKEKLRKQAEEFLKIELIINDEEGGEKTGS